MSRDGNSTFQSIDKSFIDPIEVTTVCYSHGRYKETSRNYRILLIGEERQEGTSAHLSLRGRAGEQNAFFFPPIDPRGLRKEKSPIAVSKRFRMNEEIEADKLTR